MSKQSTDKPLFLFWLRSRAMAMVLLLCCTLIFALVLWAYRVAWHAAAYAGLLCLLPLALVFVVDYLRSRARYRAILHLEEGLPESLTYLPVPIEPGEQAAGRLLTAMEALYRRRVTSDDQRYRQMTDYYTLWGHQIKTPIAAMRLLLAQEDSRMARQLSGELFKIEQYAEMALHYMRLDSQASDFVFSPCDLQEVCARLARKFAAMFVAKGLSLQIDVPKGTVQRSDEKWLSLALEQLLSNAIKYTAKGGVRIAWAADTRTLTVSDTGIGISPQDLPRVFEQGFTGYNGRVDRESTGIGLFLCREVCRRLGIGVRLDAQPGQGTQAILRFPPEGADVE